MATTPWVASLYADLFAYKSAEARAPFQQLEEEQTRAALVPAAPRMEWDEPLRWQLGRDARLSVATLEQDTGPLPILPRPGWDEVEWQRWFGSQFQNQTQEADTGLGPIIPARAWDETDWQKITPTVSGWTDAHFQQDDEPWHTFFLVPQPPPTRGWDDWDWSRDFSLLCVQRQTVEQEPPSLPAQPPSAGWLDDGATLLATSAGSLAAMVVVDDFVNAPSGIGPFGPAPLGRSVRFGFSTPGFR